jgi:methionyl aminopeptidase
MVFLKKPEEIAMIRESGKILAAVLKILEKKTKVGVSLRELDSLATKELHLRGAKSAFLNYCPEGARRPYPANVCISINDVVVHGIPSPYVIKNGDLVKIDLGVDWKGMISDAALTVAVKINSPAVRRLVRATREALYAGIKAARLGRTVGDIGFAINRVARKNKLAVIRGLGGHGVGFRPHEDPMIYNYGKRGTGTPLREGMVIALEPMFSLGDSRVIERPDGSFATADRSLTAHFEHTIAITKRGPKILTD